MKDLFACLAGLGAVLVASMAETRLREDQIAALDDAPLTVRKVAVVMAPLVVLVPLNMLIGHHVAKLASKE